MFNPYRSMELCTICFAENTRQNPQTCVLWIISCRSSTIMDYCTSCSSFTRLPNFSKYEMLMFGGMNRSPSSRLSERQVLNMSLNKSLYLSSNPDSVSRADQNALPSGTSKFSFDDTFIACDRSNWSKLRSTPRAVRNAPGAARDA